MRRAQQIAVVLLAAIVLAGSWLVLHEWRRQRFGGRTAAGVSPVPDLSRWPREFALRVRETSQQAMHGPDPVGALGQLAMLYAANGFNAEGDRALATLRKIDPQNPRWPYYLATRRMQAGQVAEARALMEIAVSLAPDYPPALLHQAELRARNGQASAAKAPVERDPWLDDLNLTCYDSYRLQGMGVYLIHNGKDQEALVFLEKAARLAPGDYEINDAWAEALQGLGRYEAARQILETAAAQSPGYDFYSRLSEVLCQEGKPAAAVDVVTRGLKALPERASLYNALGIALAQQRRNPEAIAAFRHALAQDPTLTQAYLNLAHALIDSGEIAEGQANLLRAIALRPNYPEALVLLTQMELGRSDWAKAQEHVDQLTALAETTPPVRRLYLPLLAQLRLAQGNGEMQAGHQAEAEKSFRSGLAASPDFGPLHGGLGVLLANEGRNEDALGEFHRYVTVSPTDSGAYLMLGLAEASFGRPAEARAAYVQGLALARQSGDAPTAARFEQMLSP